MMPPRSLFTIGYEGLDVETMLSRLASARIRILLDVRYRPQSRKRGFSRVRLKEFCERAGIEYVHSRMLGTPPEMMRRLGVGGYDGAAFDEYRRFLAGQSEALREAQVLVTRGQCCLLCYESDASTCHRHVVAEELSRLTGADVRHL